ncbi:MAG: hypothetical protein BIFFINMI_02831 [Phycisphaerae bacterium]|nr:hypothetical protein [Phycisphaerae bacterium]
MAQHEQSPSPRTFFLNEGHELSPVERDGGGRLPHYAGISWAAKARQLSRSLNGAVRTIEASHDPLKDRRYFLLALPVADVEKESTNKKKAPSGTFKEKTEYGGAHGRVFDRLGLDLLQVTDIGQAVVHAEKERIDQLVQRATSLDSLGLREQSRWVTIDSFDAVPLQLRVDADWLKGIRSNETTDVVIELQPVLTRVEADTVLRAIADLLVQREGEKLTGTGTDFSGRHWFRGEASQRSIRGIAKDFFSVQAIHSPLYSIAAGKAVRALAGSVSAAQPQPPPPNIHELPCVAVVDLGIPANHKQLGPYRRGQFVPQDAPPSPVGDHGSFVASRIVFGDHSTHDDLNSSIGRCTFYDALVAEYPDGSGQNDRVNDKIVMDAVRGVRGAAPDVRVFNMSFGDSRPLDAFDAVVKHEKRLLLQDLDNFIFANDVIVVVAAGNSQPGVVPNPLYPGHHADPRWALGPWACGFNTLICGAYVSRPSADGLVRTVGWPSPFTRIGPGLCAAPIPSFCAPGGNTDTAYRPVHGMGVWGFSGAGLPEDRIGTSHAAPILARESAITLAELQKYCMPGTQPFAVTARAFLTLTATRPVNDRQIADLAERTLGHGRASVGRLVTPANGSAVIIWQGYIDSPADKVRVQLPIPVAWLDEAQQPVLRIVICADPPVSEVGQATWACRHITPVLHPGPDVRGIRAPHGGHDSFPTICREYRLSRYKPGKERAAEGDMWLVELSYEEVAPYPPGMDFDPRQRVAFAAELVDLGESPIDPQVAMQSLSIAASMTRLSIQPVAVRSPIIVRTR